MHYACQVALTLHDASTPQSGRAAYARFINGGIAPSAATQLQAGPPRGSRWGLETTYTNVGTMTLAEVHLFFLALGVLVVDQSQVALYRI